RFQADYTTSLTYLESALNIYEATGDKASVAVTYGEMGSNYASMLEHKTAIEYYLKGIKILENTPEKKRLTVIKQKLVNTYLKTKELDFAIEMYEECLSSMKETNDTRNYYLTLINYGDCLTMMQKYKKAQVAFIEAIEGLKSFQSDELVGLSHNKLSRVYLQQNNIPLALKHSKAAFDYIKKVRNFRTMRIAAEYIEVLNITKNYKKALEVIDFVKNTPNQEMFNVEDQMVFQSAAAETYKHTDFKDLAVKSLENVSVLKDSILNINRE